MVSGIEPEGSPRAEFGDDAAADAAVVADSPPKAAS
jgi:hypothetical protein